MHLPTMVRLVVGIAMFGVAALGLVWLLEGTTYVLGTVGIVLLVVMTVCIALVPELRGVY
ncbi:hypothetical protein [Haloarchaeobius sp. HRN-SO-5]|uniref:hypothetical protein n=1 Tax=Haloarchaeobius sp. HRN-SO-5 TaxID=3446118 RepID=UPI003EC067E7